MSTDFRKLEKSSHDSAMSELDIFEAPLSKSSIVEGELFELGPERHPVGNSPVAFEISGNTSYYIDLSNTLLHLQCKIKKLNGDSLATDANDIKITHANNLFHSLFSNVKIFINQREIENNAHYAHKAFMTTVLNHGKEAKSTHLTSAKWINDEMMEEHTANLSAEQKTLMAARSEKLVGSKTLDMVGRPITPLFTQGRYLVPGLDIRVEFEFNHPRFVLQRRDGDDTDEYKIDISKISLLVRRLKVHPSIAAAHASLLSGGKRALYPINHTDVQFFTVSPGRQDQSINIINNKQEAKVVIVGLMNHTAKNGSLDYSPFKFEHFNISSMNMTVNGSNVLNNPLHLNFTDDIYTRAYHNLLSVCDKTHADEGNNITLEHYKKSLCLFAFDLTPDWCHGEGSHLIRSSTTSLDLKFSQPLAETVSVMVYYEFDDILRIDKTRSVDRASQA